MRNNRSLWTHTFCLHFGNGRQREVRNSISFDDAILKTKISINSYGSKNGGGRWSIEYYTDMDILDESCIYIAAMLQKIDVVLEIFQIGTWTVQEVKCNGNQMETSRGAEELTKDVFCISGGVSASESAVEPWSVGIR